MLVHMHGIICAQTSNHNTLILLSIPEDNIRCPDLGNSLMADTLLWPALYQSTQIRFALCAAVNERLGPTTGRRVSLEHSICLEVHLSEGLFQYLEEYVDTICPGSRMDSQLVDNMTEKVRWEGGGGEDSKREWGTDGREEDMETVSVLFM